MCSNGGCSVEDEMVPKEEIVTLLKDKLCPKCELNKGEVVLRSKDIYCKECLLTYLNHKFRAALGKSKMMRPHDKVLVTFSGSHSSMALLHLLRQGMDQTRHKKILFSACVLYIDDGSVSKLNNSERKKINLDISNSMKEFNFDNHFVCIEQAIEPVEPCDNIEIFNDVSELPIDQLTKERNINQFFDSISSLSSKQYLIHALRNKIINKVARKMKCSKVFTAETQTDLAIKIISNISLGKGAHVPLDVGFSDDRSKDLITLRPLRDFSSKEIIYYNLFNGLNAVHVPSISTLADPLGSLQKAAETFVTDLQTNFPSTVSTVFRTADKLSLNTNNLDTASACLLCSAPLDTKSKACSSMQATSFSRFVSNSSKAELDNVVITEDTNSVDTLEFNQQFCYACQYVIKEMKPEQGQPRELLIKSLEKSQEHLRDQIKDFIL